MTNLQDIVAALTAADREPEERLKSLQALDDYLHDEEAVFALIEAAKKETTLRVRAAMLEKLLSVDMTRLLRRDEYLEAVGGFSAFEAEPDLRALANRRLAELAPSHVAAQTVLAENLLYDFNEGIQRDALAGLGACPRKERSTVDRLIVYAGQVPPALREKLLDVYAQLERADFEAGLLALLNPLESPALRKHVLDLLAKLSSLSPALAPRLAAYLVQEPLPELRQMTVQILSNGVQCSLEFLRAVLEAVRQSPEEASLLYAFWDRLFAFPEAAPELQAFFKAAGSRRVKLYVLKLLGESESASLFTAALEDPNPWVRRAALDLCIRRGRAHASAVSQALAARIALEPMVSLRVAMIGALSELGRIEPAVEQFMIRWISQETSPDAQRMLASTLPHVAVTDANRRDLLKAYVKVLKEPFYDEALKKQITEKLQSFAYRDEPELKDCLQALMEHDTDLHKVETFYRQLRTQVVDVAPLLPFLRRLLYRFIGNYAQAPLDEWLRELAAGAAHDAALRAEIPYLVRLTGETWILEKADAAAQKSALLPAILERIKQGRLEWDTERLLSDAYENRTLRKSDAIALLERLLTYHNTYPLLQPLLEIMKKTQIVTPDVIGRCLSNLSLFPRDSHAYMVDAYLTAVGPLDASYPGRVVQAFTPQTYRRFQLASTDMREDTLASPDWKGQWRLPVQERWPLAELFFDNASTQIIAEKLESPLHDHEPAHESLPYFILAYLNRDRKIVLDHIFFLALGRLIRAVRDAKELAELHDRALFYFDKSWPDYIKTLKNQSLDPELAKIAADVFIELCARRADETLPDPAPLVGMDLDHLEARWSLGPAAWEALWARYTTYLNPPRTLFQRNSNRPSRHSKEPLRFTPMEEHRLLEPLVAFLFYTPLGSQGAWRERWKKMLLALQENPQGRLPSQLKTLDEPNRQRILSLLM